jgi:hypothetical protein
MYQHQNFWALGFGYSFGFWVWVFWVLGQFWFWGIWDLDSFGVLVLVFFSDYCNEAIHRASQTSHNVARVTKTSLY